MREPLLAKILRYALYITAFMPLIIFSQYISPFHFGKVIIFRSIVEVLFVLYLLLIWTDRSYLPKITPIFWSFLAFCLAFSVTTITSVIPYVSFWGSLERMGGLWTFWHYFVFYVILISTLRESHHWKPFVHMMFVSSLLSAFYGFGQKTNIEFFIGSGGRDRIFGTIGNAALFAGYQIVNIFLALTLLVRRDPLYRNRFLYGAVVSFGSLAVLMTVVRGSLLALGVGFMLFTLLYYLNFSSPKAKKIFLSFCTAAALFFVVLITPVKNVPFIDESRFLHRLTDTSFESFTAKTRFWAWEAGLKGWSESPKTILLGWGPENFNIPFAKYFNPKFFTGYGSETLFDRAHNMFVEVLVTMGLMGLLTYLSIFAAAIMLVRRIGKRSREDKVYEIGFLSLLVAYAIHNSFIFDTSANFLVFFSVLGFITFMAVPERIQVQQRRAPGPLRVVVGTALLVCAMILAYRTNITAAKANHTTTRAIIEGWANNFAGSVAKYKEAMQYNVAGKYEIRHRYAQYILEQSSNVGKLTPEFIEAVELAIIEVTKNRDENLPDYLPELYLSRLNIVLGREDAQSSHNDEALRHSMRALEISPTFIRTYYEIAQAYLNKKEYSKAIDYFRRAAELNPDVGLSLWYLGIIELSHGNAESGLRYIEEALTKDYSPSESDLQRLADVYVEKKDYRKLIGIYEQLVALNPKNPQYFASLAFVYAQVGRIDDAINAARKAAVLDPSYLEQARAFARQLGREL